MNLNQPHLQRLYGILEINKTIVQDALISHDRNRALHDCEKNPVNAVNDILAYPYERQRTHTDMFFRIPDCVAAQ